VTAAPSYRFNERGFGTHQAIAELVAPNTVVLDVGCASGYLMEHLRREKGCRCIGIEPDPDAAARASSRGFEVIGASAADALGILGPDRQFDHIIFGDVLEHMSEPLGILTQFSSRLSMDGLVVVSLPNVVSLHARLRLAFGIWRYEDMGIFDRTHLRFFTIKTGRELLSDAGLCVVSERFVGPLTFYGGRRLAFLTGLRPQLLANGMVFGARLAGLPRGLRSG